MEQTWKEHLKEKAELAALAEIEKKRKIREQQTNEVVRKMRRKRVLDKKLKRIPNNIMNMFDQNDGDANTDVKDANDDVNDANNANAENVANKD